MAYQPAPTAAERARLEEAFDALVEHETGYAALDDRISKTADQRAQVLAVLAWDTFQTLAATAAKLGVGFFHYLRDRIVTPETTPT